jgi:HEAT repeat protein
MEALKSDEPLMHQAAIAALGEIGAVESVDDLLQFAGSPDWLVRQQLAEALGNLPAEKSLSALRYLTKDSHPQVAEAAELAMQRLLQYHE